MRNGSKSDVSPKPKARRSLTPAPSMVGTDWLTRLTGRMDMSPPGRIDRSWLPKYCRCSSFETEEVWRIPYSETVLGAKIGIERKRCKSIERSDWIYRSR